jgi:acyl-homoserine-lactone acylase
MGYETLENNRSLRFAELVAKYPKVSYADFKSIKFDRQYPTNFAFQGNIDSLFLLNPKEYPEIADIIQNLNQWDKKSNMESVGAGTFLFVYQIINKDKNTYFRNGGITSAQAATVLTIAKKQMLEQFGRTDLKLGDVQKLVRGEKAIPLPGLPDVLAPMYAIPYQNGMWKGNQGDAYIELVRFTKDGPMIESINAYGASSKPGSPHYTDQMEMFTHQQTKPMTLNKKEVYLKAEKIYHPEKIE